MCSAPNCACPLDPAVTAWRIVRSAARDSPNRVITWRWLSGLPAAMDAASVFRAAVLVVPLRLGHAKHAELAVQSGHRVRS
jgi:hypothetical protein